MARAGRGLRVTAAGAPRDPGRRRRAGGRGGCSRSGHGSPAWGRRDWACATTVRSGAGTGARTKWPQRWRPTEGAARTRDPGPSAASPGEPPAPPRWRAPRRLRTTGTSPVLSLLRGGSGKKRPGSEPAEAAGPGCTQRRGPGWAVACTFPADLVMALVAPFNPRLLRLFLKPLV